MLERKYEKYSGCTDLIQKLTSVNTKSFIHFFSFCIQNELCKLYLIFTPIKLNTKKAIGFKIMYSFFSKMLQGQRNVYITFVPIAPIIANCA